MSVIVSLIHKHGNNIYWFDLSPNGEKNFISVYLIIDKKTALIETGPACSTSELVSGIEAVGIELEDIDFVVPTHIHLDHFGGGGNIMELCQNAKAVIHPKACRHVSKIEDWWNGSSEFLGEIAELYGQPAPIPKSRIISAEEGMELPLGEFSLTSIHTPGHAPHHITWKYGKEAFVGDSLGLWYSNLGTSFPVTPGYYRHDLALSSIYKMSNLDLDFLHYTHFGPRAVKGAFNQIKIEFEEWMKIVLDGNLNGLSSIEILEILFDNRLFLRQTDIKHGIHQKSTHLGSVEGMLGWIRRQNAEG